MRWAAAVSLSTLILQNEDPPVVRLCYNEMRHEEGDVLKPRYCVLLASGSRKKDLPFVAKISAMWEDPNNGESCQLAYLDEGLSPNSKRQNQNRLFNVYVLLSIALLQGK